MRILRERAGKNSFVTDRGEPEASAFDISLGQKPAVEPGRAIGACRLTKPQKGLL